MVKLNPHMSLKVAKRQDTFRFLFRIYGVDEVELVVIATLGQCVLTTDCQED